MIKSYAKTNFVTNESFWDVIKQEIHSLYKDRDPTDAFRPSYIKAYAKDLVKRCALHDFNTSKVHLDSFSVMKCVKDLNNCYSLER